MLRTITLPLMLCLSAAVFLLAAGPAQAQTRPRLEDIMGECTQDDLEYCGGQPSYCSPGYVLCENGSGFISGENAEIIFFDNMSVYPEAEREAMLNPCHFCQDSRNAMIENLGYSNLECKELDISADFLFGTIWNNSMSEEFASVGVSVPNFFYKDSMHILLDYAGCLQVEYDVDNRNKVNTVQVQGAWVSDFSAVPFIVDSTFAIEPEQGGNPQFFTETDPKQVTVHFPEYRSPALHYSCTIFQGGNVSHGAFPLFEYSTWEGIPPGWVPYQPGPQTWPRYAAELESNVGPDACRDIMPLVNESGVEVVIEYPLVPEDWAKNGGWDWQGTATLTFRND